MKSPICTFVLGAALAWSWSGAAAAGEIFIPLGSADAIAVVDPARHAVVGRIEGIPSVHGLAATPDGRFLIAGAYDERTPGQAPPPRPAGVSEAEHAAHHAVRPATTGGEGPAVGTVTVIRTADRSVVRRIDVPGAVHHVAVGPDGRFAVVTHPNRDAVSVIDLTSSEVVATVPTGAAPNYAAFSPDGGHVYVSNAGSATVSDVDARRWTVGRTLGVGTGPEHIVLSRDGGTLFVNNVDDGTVAVVALDTGKVARTIDVGTTLHGLDLSDDGGTLFISAIGDDRIVAADPSTGETRDAKLAPAPYHLTTVRGTGRIYVSSADRPKVWVVDQATLSVVGEFAIGGKGHQMVQTAAR